MSVKAPRRYRGPGGLANFGADLRAIGCDPNSDNDRARCPGHDGKNRNLAYKLENRGRLLLKCHSAGCSREEIFAGLERRLQEGGGGSKKKESLSLTPRTDATAQPLGITLPDYVEAKELREAFLREMFGLEDYTYGGVSNIRIPYYNPDGSPGPIRIRKCLKKGNPDKRFIWPNGSHVSPYGLWLLEVARKAGYVVIVEGESDVQTLVHAGIPALGIPGANMWRDEWAEYLDGIERIYVVEEPDAAGQKLVQDLVASPLADRLSIISLAPHKDPSDLWLSDPNKLRFRQRFNKMFKAAVPAAKLAEHEHERLTQESWEQCKSLAQRSDILRTFDRDVSLMGIVGERRATRLVFLALISRLQERPVSIIVKGPSSGGKNAVVDVAVRFVPASACYKFSTMSPHHLIYSEEEFKHRTIYFAEAGAAFTTRGDDPRAEGGANTMALLLRTLLSEGRLRHGTVSKDADGNQVGRVIEKEGPTNALVTTTRIRVDAELETRLVSVQIDDSPEQTARIVKAQANGHDREPDLTRWHAHSNWLENGECRVEIPFSKALAELIPPIDVRIRRDHLTVRSLVKSHALLHRATRKLDSEGRILATIDDYAAVRELIVDLISEGVAGTVPPRIRKTVKAVSRLMAAREAPHIAESVSVRELSEALGLDRVTAWRRARDAVSRGYLRNLEDHLGRPVRLVLGEPFPAEREILPTPERLRRCVGSEGESEKQTLKKPRKKKKGVATPKPRPRRGDSHQPVGDPR